jgi:hypothetical protein
MEALSSCPKPLLTRSRCMKGPPSSLQWDGQEVFVPRSRLYVVRDCLTLVLFCQYKTETQIQIFSILSQILIRLQGPSRDHGAGGWHHSCTHGGDGVNAADSYERCWVCGLQL